MKNILIVGLFLILFFASCTKVQMVATEECAKVVGRRYYANMLLGKIRLRINEFLILENGKEVRSDFSYRVDQRGIYCETNFHEQPDLDLNQRPPG